MNIKDFDGKTKNYIYYANENGGLRSDDGKEYPKVLFFYDVVRTYNEFKGTIKWPN